MDDGIVEGGRLWNAGEGGCLGDGELIEALAEVGLRRGRHAIGALAEEDDIEIELEDIGFAELAIHLEDDEGFLELAPPGLVECQENVARGLHGDGAAALHLLARDQIDDGGARERQRADAAFLEEAVILRGEKCLAYERRNLVIAHGRALLGADLRDEISGGGVDAQRHFQLHIAHLRGRRERGLQIQVAARVEVRPEKCDQHHTAQSGDGNANLFPFHRKRLSLLALLTRAMHSSARFRANSPKGGDAKPPVYGTHVPMTAGLPVGFQTVLASRMPQPHPKARLQIDWIRHRYLSSPSIAGPYAQVAHGGRRAPPDVTRQALYVPGGRSRGGRAASQS
jgi:hypothetical protein